MGPAAARRARAVRAAHTGGLPVRALLADHPPLADLEPTTAASKALAKELKRRGFVFVGPTTVYATMEAVGVVNDHLEGCAFR